MAGYIGATPVPQATQHRKSFTATAGQTSFATGGYTPGFIDVYLNGVKLAAADFTATNGSDVVLASGAAVGDILETISFTAFEIASQTFSGTTTVDDLSVTGAFTSQGIDDNANATAITIDSSENVGIGTTSPTDYDGEADNLVVASSGHTGITIASTGSNQRTNLYFSDGTTGSDAYRGGFSYDHNDDHLLVRTAAAERMRIDSSGNLSLGNGASINTLSSTHSITVQGGAGAPGGAIRFAGGTGDNDLRFSTSSSERMRLDSSGRVMVGTTSYISTAGFNPLFSVQSATNVAVFKATTGSAVTGFQSGGTTNAQNFCVFLNGNGSAIGSIQVSNGTSGSATSYNTSSDYRLKTGVQPMTGASERVQALNPVNFEWISDGTRVDGFLAHEAQAVVPEAITGEKDAMRDEEYEVTPAVEATFDEEGNVLTEAVDAVMGTRSVPDYQGIDQSKIVPLLTAALKEALTEITALKTRVTALEAE